MEDLTAQGMGHVIGDGRKTKLWSHRWLYGKQLLPLTLRDNWANLSRYLSEDILKQIASYDLVQNEVEDDLAWLPSKKGSFTIKSGVAIIQNEQDKPPNPMCRSWRCSTHLGKKEEIPPDKGTFLQARFQVIIQALENNSIDETPQRVSILTERLVHWDSPLGDWVMLNSNGAVKGNTVPAAARGVF
ncbi:hypothetical protein Cgig2_004051 [Carnegiea gigantea]|uniref:Uncharacterized protein n=1 Tax=Carnegiea gigantea TaxID=171969 RepID=A0A9Q1QPI1_9CARY|nr:hypothetical protein Cgig2_004051 [Carnegiea gigantea]